MKKSKPVIIIGGDGAGGQSEDSFACALTRVAVTQTCESVGFKRAQNWALDVLSNIAALYLQSVAKSAACSANRHSRTQSNLPDVIFALEDLSDAAATAVRSRSVYSSPVIKDLIKFVRYTDEIPFAQPLPSVKMFHKGARSHQISKFRGSGGDNNNINNGCRFYGGRLSYVPRWLPPVPAVDEVLKKGDRESKWGCLHDRVEGHVTRVAVVQRAGNDEGIGTTPLLGKRERVRFRIRR